jgi:hypothetical protein
LCTAVTTHFTYKWFLDAKNVHIFRNARSQRETLSKCVSVILPANYFKISNNNIYKRKMHQETKSKLWLSVAAGFTWLESAVAKQQLKYACVAKLKPLPFFCPAVKVVWPADWCC